MHKSSSDRAPSGQLSTPPLPPEEFVKFEAEGKQKGREEKERAGGELWAMEAGVSKNGACQIKSRQSLVGVE